MNNVFNVFFYFHFSSIQILTELVEFAATITYREDKMIKVITHHKHTGKIAENRISSSWKQ